MKGKPLVVWDWNGTLLDDTLACVGALNAMQAKRGLATVTLEFFRDNFSFPSRRFYEQIGMKVADSEWAALAREYYATYCAQTSIALNAEAVTALERVRAAGCRQMVLSALRQDFLERDLVRYGIRDFFVRVYGSDNLDGGSKLDRAREMVSELAAEGLGERPVMIGDSIHDCEVAEAVGADCVLAATGSHSYARLAAVAPTAMTLSGAIELALAEVP